MGIPDATAIVLRDRTNSDPQQVLVTAIDGLVAAGVWTAKRRRRPWAPRGVFTFVPTAAAPPADLVEPLRTVDTLLRAAAQALDPPLTAPALGRWLAVARPAAPAAVVRTTIEDLVARGLLLRTVTALKPTPAAEATLAAATIPPAVRPSAHDAATRAAGLRALSPLGRQLVLAAAKTGAHGFPAGAVGAGVSPSGQGNGDNVQAAIRTGTGTL